MRVDPEGGRSASDSPSGYLIFAGCHGAAIAFGIGSLWVGGPVVSLADSLNHRLPAVTPCGVKQHYFS
jgi:hypothetical protein